MTTETQVGWTSFRLLEKADPPQAVRDLGRKWPQDGPLDMGVPVVTPKGAQPEQLVEEARRTLFAVVDKETYEQRITAGAEAEEAIDALATALSECRERERSLEHTLEAIVESRNCSDVALRMMARDARAAQPPSEASETPRRGDDLQDDPDPEMQREASEDALPIYKDGPFSV